MIIDWFTTIAQAVNFLILVALLKHFLFTPIVRAMHERQAKSDKVREDSENKDREAAKAREAYLKKEREMDEKREELVRQAMQDARRQGDEYLRKLRRESDEENERLEDALKNKMLDIAERLRLMALHDAAGMTERSVRELSAVPIEEGLVDVFIRKLNTTVQDEKERIAAAAAKGGNTLEVKSSFSLGKDLQDKLSGAVRSELSKEISLTFRVAPDLAMGIEMEGNGYKLLWGVEQFLEDVEGQVSKVITDSFGNRRWENK